MASRKRRWVIPPFAVAYVLHVFVGNAIFYIINSLFLVLPSFIDEPVPEGEKIAADMSFTAQSGAILLLFYMFMPKRPQPNPSLCMAVITVAAMSCSFILSFFWSKVWHGRSITLWIAAALSGSIGTFGNLFAWVWCSRRNKRLFPALSRSLVNMLHSLGFSLIVSIRFCLFRSSNFGMLTVSLHSGMAASALIPSLLSVVMDPGEDPRFSVMVFYLIAAGFMALAGISLWAIEFWDLGNASGTRIITSEEDTSSVKTLIVNEVNQPAQTDSETTHVANCSESPPIMNERKFKLPSKFSSRNIATCGEDHHDPDEADEQTSLLPYVHSDYQQTILENTQYRYISGWKTNSGFLEALRDTISVHKYLMYQMTLLWWCVWLIFGWQPGLVPYLMPNGRPLVYFQVCGQVADVIGRTMAGLQLLDGKQAAVIQTATFVAMLILAFSCNQRAAWYTPVMAIINTIFSFAYGVASTRTYMSAHQFQRASSPTSIDTDRVLQLMGASTSIGSATGGISVYFVVHSFS